VTPTLAIVGGLLGAGKTTLILSAAHILRQRGLRVAVILNDQGHDLVDTHLVQASGLLCDQVAGGCFCCRFPELISAAGRLAAFRPDVIFAEAVGSCTDVVATTVLPLVRDYGEQFRIAPLTVVMHPQRSFDNPYLSFLNQHQVAEADLLFERGDNVAAWLERVLSATPEPGARRIKVDYARYAEAEAVLAWLNGRLIVRASPPVSAPMLIGPLLDRVDRQVRIVHLKMFVQSDAGYLKAALIANGAEPQLEGALDASPSVRHELLINVRALHEPEALRTIIVRECASLPGEVVWLRLECFRPSPPVPYHASTEPRA
jgi:hypothetical protein